MSLWKPVSLKDALRWICVVSCVLSVIGSLGIIIAYWRYPKLRKPARHLLLWLSVTDLGTALIYIITIIGCYDCDECSNGIKLLTAVIGVFFPVASFLWTDCIAIYIFGASYQKKWVNPTKRLFTIFHCISWIVPLILSLILIIIYFADILVHMTFSSDYTGGWCWVDTLPLQLIGGKVVEGCSYIFLIVIYSATYCKLNGIKSTKKKRELLRNHEDYNENNGAGSIYNSKRSQTFNSNHDKINELLTRLALIPLIFIILRAPGTLRVLLVPTGAIKNNGTLDNMLQILQAFCDPLQGFCNAVLFLLCVSTVRETIFNIQGPDFRYREIVVQTTTSQQNDNTGNNTMGDTNTITSLSSVMHNKPNPLL